MPIKRCKAAFAAVVNGAPRVITVGQLIEADDPIVKGREACFEDVDTYMTERAARTEQATAGPGERRSVALPAKKAAARKPDPAKAESKTPAVPEATTEKGGTP
ncbi:hypothetical protein ACWGVR_14405 [Streptomyces xanthophaeus]